MARRGRPPKPDKRVPLSLLVDPALRSSIVAMATKHGRTITRQVEFLLKKALRDHSRSLDQRLDRIAAKLDRLIDITERCARDAALPDDD